VAGNTGTGVPRPRELPQIDAAHRFVSGEIRNRSTVDISACDDDVQHVDRDLENRLVVDLADAKPLLVDSREEKRLPPARDGQRVAELYRRILVRLEDPISLRRIRSTNRRASRASCSSSRVRRPNQLRSRLHDVGAVLDVPQRS